MWGTHLRGDLGGVAQPEHGQRERREGAVRAGCSSEEVYCGGTAFEPEDFRDRVVVALALADTDPGRPASTTSSPGGGTFVECGVPAGYLQDRLSELLEVADFAVAHGRQVIAC